MISPIFEKFVMIAGGLLVLAGLGYLFNHYPTQAIAFVIATIAGTALVGGLVFFFTRSPA